MIADATAALKLKPDVALYNLRGSAYYDKGEYDIAIADFNDALRTDSPQGGIVYHNRGNAWRGKGDYAKAIADYDASIKFDPKAVFSYQNRGACKQALGDLDGALADINEAIRLDPTLPSPLNQPRRDLACQGRLRPRRRRHDRGHSSRQGEKARQHHDAAGQRADYVLHPACAGP